MSNSTLGIDLGTTFSLVSIIRNENPVIVRDKSGKNSIPSIVNFQKNSDGVNITVGNAALKRQKISPKMTVYDSKRMLGRKFNDEHIQNLRKKWPFNIERSESGGILICVEGIEQKYHPYEISGLILKHLAEVGNSHLPPEDRTNRVVITIPANFGEEQRTETMKAAEYAGLHVLQLINEPTAAGLAYGFHNPNPIQHHVFVFDFGGGTLDVSLLCNEGKDIKVIATDGDMFLGGRDFDDKLVDFLIKHFGFDENFCKNRKKMNKLREAAVEAKIELSMNDETPIILDDGEDEDEGKEYTLKLNEFEEINKELINRILIPVQNLLDSVHFNKDQINSIILVGGSSKMQFVKKQLKEYFGKEPYNGVDPEEAVSNGAGIVASKYNEEVSPGSLVKTLEYTDICPISIGSANFDGTMVVLIPKGTRLPSTPKTQRFQTVLYRQEVFPVDIYEGENEFVSNNYPLSQFDVKGLPQSDDDICFDVTFTLDTNGILSASAKLVDGELYEEQQIKIEKAEECFSQSTRNSGQNPKVNALKLFYINIQRFITFNQSNFLDVYGKQSIIDSLIGNARVLELNANSIDETDLKVHIDKYKYTILKKYFHRYHNIPSFLRD